MVEEEASLFVVHHKKSFFAHFVHFELIESIQVLEVVAIFDGKTLGKLLNHDYYVGSKEHQNIALENQEMTMLVCDCRAKLLKSADLGALGFEREVLLRG